MPGNETCESDPAMAVDGIHDYAPTDANQMALDLSQYGTGMYLIRLSSEKGIFVKRVSVVK